MKPRVSLLASYWFWKEVDLDAVLAPLVADFDVRLFADSGAYSAMTTGSAVDLDAYADWLKRWGHHFAQYTGLDVIGDWKATARNQELLEASGFSPLPVFHWGSPMAELERLIERYSFIALGGLVGLQKRCSLPWIAECFRRAAGKSVRFHGFGVTSIKAMNSFPWRSVDSSTWTVSRRFAMILLLDKQRETIVRYHIGASRQSRSHEHRSLVSSRGRRLLAQHGIDTTKAFVDTRDPGFGRMIEQIGFRTMRRAEAYIREKNPEFEMYQVIWPTIAGPASVLEAMREAG